MSETQRMVPPAETDTTAPPERAWLPEAYRADPSFANFKDVDGLAASYKSASSMVGMDKGRVLALPKDDADPAAWDGVYKQLGRPEKPEDYGVKVDGPDGELWNRALPELHKAGLSKRQVESLQGLIGKMGEEQAAAFADPAKAVETYLPRVSKALADEAFADRTAAQLKQEWGAAYDDRMHAANRVAAQFAESGNAEILKLFKTPENGGYGLANLPGFVAMLAEIGTKMAEPGGLVGGAGQNQSRAMTPADASAKIAAMQSDREFGKRLLAGDRDATREWNDANAALAAGR